MKKEFLIYSHTATIIENVAVSYKMKIFTDERKSEIFDVEIENLNKIVGDKIKDCPLVYQNADDVMIYYLRVLFDFDFDEFKGILKMKEGQTSDLKELNVIMINIADHFGKKIKNDNTTILF